MSSLKLNDGGDLDLSGGALSLISGPLESVQKLRIRLQFFLGEWFLDQNIGIPYYERIFLKNPNLVDIQGIFRKTAESTPGIATSDSWDLRYDNTTRTLAVSASLTTTTGEAVNFNQTFNIFQGGQ